MYQVKQGTNRAGNPYWYLVDAASRPQSKRYRSLKSAQRSADELNAGDSRSPEQWIGDVAHRTLERLELLRPELANLVRQLDLLAGWCDTRGLASAAHMLRVHQAEAMALGEPQETAALVRYVAKETGREQQPYHHHS